MSLKWTRPLSSASLLPCGKVNIFKAPLPLWIQDPHHWVWNNLCGEVSLPSSYQLLVAELPEYDTMSWGKGGLQLLSLSLSCHQGILVAKTNESLEGALETRGGARSVCCACKPLELLFWGIVFRIHWEVDQLALWLLRVPPYKKHQSSTEAAIR